MSRALVTSSLLVAVILLLFPPRAASAELREAPEPSAAAAALLSTTPSPNGQHSAFEGRWVRQIPNRRLKNPMTASFLASRASKCGVG